MGIKIEYLGSPNYQRTDKRFIKYIIIHYTGMKRQKDAIKRLQSEVAKVSCHYLLSKRGKTYQLVKDDDIAWHAGKSKWKRDTNLNKLSIGIELVNNGNEPFPKKQIKSLLTLLKKLKKKYHIKSDYVLGHQDIAPARKVDPGPYFPWMLLHKNKLTKKR